VTRQTEKILARAEEDGVDLSMLRERLRWTPTERLHRHQAALELAEALRNAKRKTKLDRNPETDDRTIRR
jgi:hypothetical protein